MNTGSCALVFPFLIVASNAAAADDGKHPNYDAVCFNMHVQISQLDSSEAPKKVVSPFCIDVSTFVENKEGTDINVCDSWGNCHREPNPNPSPTAGMGGWIPAMNGIRIYGQDFSFWMDSRPAWTNYMKIYDSDWNPVQETDLWRFRVSGMWDLKLTQMVLPAIRPAVNVASLSMSSAGIRTMNFVREAAHPYGNITAIFCDDTPRVDNRYKCPVFYGVAYDENSTQYDIQVTDISPTKTNVKD